MDVKALTAVAKSSTTIPQCSCRLLPLQIKLLSAPSPHMISMKKSKRRFDVTAASSEEYSRRRSIVDEGMVVLRKRIYELQMEEINYIPPQKWMGWEKKWYPTYGSDVCSSLLRLQNTLLNTRPAVALAMLAIMSVSVPLSDLLLLLQTQIQLKGVTMELLSYLHG